MIEPQPARPVPLLPAPAPAAPPPLPKTRKKNVPLSEEFKVKVITTFYAPAVMGTSFAARLIEAATVDREAACRPEWQAAAREAAGNIKQACRALGTLDSPGTQRAYTSAVRSSEKLARFLEIFSAIVESGNPARLPQAGKSLQQAERVLEQVGKYFLTPARRRAPARPRAARPAATAAK